MAIALRMPAALRARSGGRPAFAQVAEAELQHVYRYACQMLGDPHVAEDVTHETFERALRSWSRFDPARAKPRTWLCTIARNIAIDHFRRDRRGRESYEAWIAGRGEQQAQMPEPLSPHLTEALRELSAQEREAVVLRVLLELSGEEAAHVMGITPTACSSTLHRALGKLRRKVVLDV